MKILKIELQNINSLKSDKPICIDFTGEYFKDVGLYAITGPTGAGKTTILDAITIALYHQVPRFNQPHIKAKLDELISYGADMALSRVAFENDNHNYEATWSMRIVSRTGKSIKPKEEVRLKDLTNNTILAEKKSDVLRKVEEITRLNYKQFLRSVLLAQGDFAAFLTAKPSEKGALLEQITGDDIYRKIGETINKRKNDEYQKLANLESKINSEDILSEEQRKELDIELKKIKLEIERLKGNIIELRKIKAWYEKEEELLRQELELSNRQKKLELTTAENTNLIERLKRNKKAEPFRALLTNIKRLNKGIAEKENHINEINKKLEELVPVIEAKKEYHKQISRQKIDKEQDFKRWQLKLDNVSRLDADIENKKKIIQQTNEILTGIKENILRIKVEIDKQNREKVEYTAKLGRLKTYIENNAHIPKIEQEFTKWNADIILRNSKLLDIDKATQLKNDRLIEIDAIALELNNKIKLQSKGIEERTIIIKKLNDIQKQLVEGDIRALLSKKDKLYAEITRWRTIKAIYDNYIKELKQKNIVRSRIGNLSEKIGEEQKLLTAIKKKLDNALVLVNDAKKIVELNAKIISFEEERKKLISNEPCPLCGSTSHPYVDKYDKHSVAKENEELIIRQKNFDDISIEKLNIEKQIIAFEAEMKSAEESLIDINNELQNSEIKSANLNFKINSDNGREIVKRLEDLEKEDDNLSQKIKEIQNLQVLKDDISEKVKQITNDITSQGNEITKLKERKDNFTEEIESKKGEIALAQLEVDGLNDELTNALGQFDLSLPTAENTQLFISQIKRKIDDYTTAIATIAKLKEGLAKLDDDIKHHHEYIKENNSNKDIRIKELEDLESNLANLINVRNEILPTAISVFKKREELQKELDTTNRQLEDFNKGLNLLGNNRLQLEISINTETEYLRKSKKESLEEEKRVKDKLEQSIFDTKEDMAAALLDEGQKSEYEKVRKAIDDEATSIQALREKWRKEKQDHSNSRKSHTNNEENSRALAEAEAEKEQYQKRLGEINKQFEIDNEIKNRNKELLAKIAIQRKEFKKWVNLIQLLGGSKEAFNIYVQRLTLKSLIALANIHLLSLNNRYSLQMNKRYDAAKIDSSLEFSLVDHFQTNKVRNVNSSSGGEKFIISLALALGLSDLSSNNVKIDSLFIDEGFGTLDNELLETVITTLEALHQQGKIIGIISHVENLRERIPVQIEVVKQSNGVSKIRSLNGN